jgi:1-acyl-sn-glycerol-3-phosphate acyltransferase
MTIVSDHRGADVEATTWRTLAVFGHTLSSSARIAGRALVGRLTPERVDRRVARWCDHVFGISKTTLAVEGQEHVVPGTSYVLLGNHQSLLDIPAVCATFPGRVRFVAKQELRRVPVFGRAMAEAGIVFVDRSDRTRAIAQLQAARDLVAAGTSVWIAAEGTRSRDGTLGPFKKGGFHVARSLGAPILPTWVEGTLAVIPPGSLRSVTGQTVTVRYGAPIATRGPDGDRALSDVMDEVRTALLALRPAT